MVRAKVGEMLSAIAEPVVGAQVVRAYAVEQRTQDRIDASIEDYRRTATRAQTLTGVTFSIGGLAAGLANAGVLTVGVLLGVDKQATLGEVARVHVPGVAGLGPGADRDPGADRRAECVRGRRGRSRDRNTGRRGRPGD